MNQADWTTVMSARNSDWVDPLPRPVCGPGWTALIELAFEKMADVVRPAGCRVTVAFTEQKYGSLRIEALASDPTIQADVEQILLDAEDASERTCELCGKPGRMRGQEWLVVRCDEHSPGASSAVKGLR